MKRISNFLLHFTTFIFLFSCEKKEEAIVERESLMTFLKSQPNLSMYVAALEKANLQSYTEGPGPFTFIAPTNNAFTAAMITSDSLNRMTSGAINYFIQYHLINSLVTTVDLLGAQYSFSRGTQIGNTSSTQVFLGTGKDSAYINGANIILADKMIKNGVVHVIDEFLVPPLFKGTVQSLLQSTGQHALFIAALTKASRWATLAGTGPFTVLAPTDAAMASGGLTLTAINASTVGRIDSIVRYHYFSGARYFSNDFGDRVSTQTALGVNRTLTSSNNGRRVTGKSNTTPVNVTIRNMLGTNGVVHIVDGVLRY